MLVRDQLDLIDTRYKYFLLLNNRALIGPIVKTLFSKYFDLDAISNLTSIKKTASNGLRVLAAIGGSKTDGNFGDVFNNTIKRENFVTSSVSFMRKYDFDGMNIENAQN